MPTLEKSEPDIAVRPDYLDLNNPLEDGFEWDKFARLNRELAEKATFLVLFVSEQRDDLAEQDLKLLHTLDDASHGEAQKSEALIKYFAGNADEKGRALSWCLWSDRKAAADALHGPSHKTAIRMAREGKFYKSYAAKFFTVSLDSESGLAFTPIDTGHNLETKQEASHAVV